MKSRKEYIKKLEEIPFFKEGRHPEYIPFVEKEYGESRILQIGESHFIDNGPSGQDKYPVNKITLKDFDGWWEGKQSEELKRMAEGWYTTDKIVSNYMNGDTTKSHGIFTNFGKAFIKGVSNRNASAEEAAESYKYFAFMNFYQIPSIYRGMNFTRALYKTGKDVSGLSTSQIDEIWYECWYHSVEVFEAVVEILNPKIIVMTSKEIGKYYQRYGQKTSDYKDELCIEANKSAFGPGKLCKDKRLVIVNHPSSAWWNRKRENEDSSREKLEKKFKELQNEDMKNSKIRQRNLDT